MKVEVVVVLLEVVVVLLLLEVVKLSGVLAVRTVTVNNQTLPVLVRAGRTVLMTCSSSSSRPWFFCLWDSPGPGSQDLECAIQHDQPERVCSRNNRTRLSGVKEACRVEFQATRETHGEWMCLINDNETFTAIKRYVRLHVGVESHMGINIDGGEISWQDSLARKGILSVSVGAPIDLLCFAYDGYPGPTFIWLPPSTHNLSASLQIYESPSEKSNSSHTISGSSLARYMPQVEDHNKTISCTVKQEEEGRTHYTKTFMFKLEVNETPTNAQRNDIIIKEISFLTSITVAFIFFILLSVLLCVSKYRRRNKNLKNLNEKETDEMSAVLEIESSALLYPGGCEPVSTPRWASQRLYSSPPLDLQPFLTAERKKFTSPSLRSLSTSQLSPSESYTDLRANSKTDKTKFLETSFFINSFHQREATSSIPPPRPPRYSKSLGHIHKILDQDQQSKRRRSVATCKSTHSLFECSEGCFDIEDNNKQIGQFVTITTGPILC